MPIGGTFTPGVEKVRPGFYMNFASKVARDASLASAGVVIMPLLGHKYGPLKQFLTIDNSNQDGQFAKLGYTIDAAELLLIREAFKAAAKVIVYIPGTGGVKASASIAPLTVTMKYVGSRGNAAKLVVTTNPVAGKDVQVLLGTTVVYSATGVTNVADLVASAWVDFSGTGALVVGNVSFTSGTDATTANADVTDFLAASETQDWKAMAFPSTDASLLTALNTQIRYFRESIGKKVVAVSPANTANYEGILNVVNGVILADGTTLTPAQTCAWVAAICASAGAAKDNTYEEYPNAVDANPRLTHANTVTGLQTGQFIFSVVDGVVRVEEDINSLTTLTTDKDESYTDNRVIRTFDAIATTGASILLPNKYDNNLDGLKLAQQDLVTILTDLQTLNALKNVDVDNDVIIDTVKSTGKSFYATVAVQPVRTFKKYYITVQTA